MNHFVDVLSPAQVETWLKSRFPQFRRVGGADYRGPCPLHKGRDANFSINANKGLWYCHSQCQRGGSIIQLEMEITSRTARDAIEEISRITGAPLPNGHGGLVELEAYDYVDEQGQLLFQQVRCWDSTQGKKAFKTRRPGPTGNWVWNLGRVKRVLYRLPAVLKADLVYVVEGEKDVHTLERCGLTATTNPWGAGKWEDHYAEYLRGKEVVVLHDNDDPGRRHAMQVSASLKRTAVSVVVVDPPIEYKDVTEWIRSGATAEDVRAAAESVRESDETIETGLHEPTPLPNGFELNDDGLYRSVANGKGGYEALLLCSPLEVVCKTRDARGEDWGTLLRFKDQDGRVHEFIMADALLGNERGEWRSHLLRLGLSISPAKGVSTHLRDFLFSSKVPDRATKVDQIGWHGDVFLTPAWTVPENTSERIILDDGGVGRHRYEQRGSLQDWRASVSSLCVGNALLTFAVSSAFAPILLPLRPGLGGGFHLSSNGTTGKTTNLAKNI